LLATQSNGDHVGGYHTIRHTLLQGVLIVANVTLAKVKALCTSAEHDLVKASRRPEIGQLDAAALKKHVTQARKLRDKWRDQATKQRRDTQQRHNARVADGEKRSEQKAEIFDAALAAFEKQLEKVSAATVGVSKAAPKKKATKAKRSAGHRAERAVKRGSLEAVREEMNAAGKPTKKKVANKATTAKAATTAAPKKKAVKKKTAKKGVYAAAAKKAVKQLLNQPADQDAAAKSIKGTQSEGLVGPINAKKQRRVETVAKQERLDQSGVRSRLKGHASASGRRSQGKRDSRG
jgi:hypothetical protein